MPFGIWKFTRPDRHASAMCLHPETADFPIFIFTPIFIFIPITSNAVEYKIDYYYFQVHFQAVINGTFQDVQFCNTKAKHTTM